MSVVYPIAATASTNAAKVPLYGSHYGSAGGLPPVGEYLGVIAEAPGAATKVTPGTIVPIGLYMPTSPYKYAMLTTEDHVGGANAGADLLVSNSLSSGWSYYDSSIAAEFTAAGWSGHPTSNPVATIAAPTDKGEFADAWYDPVNDRFLLTMHASAYLGGQTQRIFTSTDFLTWTEDNSAYDVVGSDATHNGYGVHSWGARGHYGQTLHQSLAPLTHTQVHAREGLHFVTDYRRLYGRECALWGYNAKEFPRHNPIIYFDGRPWLIGAMRDIPSGGGGTTNGVLSAAPLSSDLRRWVGTPVVLAALGGVGTDHEVATCVGSCRVYVDTNGTAWVTTPVEDSSGDRRIGLCKITPASAKVPWTNQPTYAITVQSGFEACLAIDHEGLPIPASRRPSRVQADYLDQLRTIADFDFATTTSTPSSVTEENKAGTPTFTYNAIATTRGELQISCGSASTDATYWFGPTFDSNDFAEFWAEVEGLRVSTTNYLLMLGFGNAGYTRQLHIDVRYSNSVARFQHYDGGSDFADAGNYNIQDDGRRVESHNFRLGVVKRYTRDKTLKVYMELWDGDQVLAVRDVTSVWAENTALRPYWRVNYTGGTVTAHVTRLRACVGDALQGS